MKILILGANFRTGNLGVSALAESTIQCILKRWPDGVINLLGGGRESYEERITINGRDVVLKNIPVRFSINIFLENHFIRYFLFIITYRLFPFINFKNYCTGQNHFIKDLIEIDIVADITGGDSFSDIYGMKRFILGFLQKWLVILYKKPLVLLPQTYGPFNNMMARLLAGFIFKRASHIYSRDRDGILYLQEIFNSEQILSKLSFIPDVAFTLEPRVPKQLDVGSLQIEKKKNSVVVGLNINGLIYSGGYTRDNMFHLKVDYKKMLYEIVEYFMAKKNVLLLLVPHFFPAIGDIEDDTTASLEIYNHFKHQYQRKIFMTTGKYDHREIKYIIGMTDFFLGSRMHSCIAALSQNIPAIGLAYSKKFYGVFEAAGVQKYSLDMRFNTHQDILNSIAKAYDDRKEVSLYLNRIMPDLKQKIINTFNSFE